MYLIFSPCSINRLAYVCLRSWNLTRGSLAAVRAGMKCRIIIFWHSMGLPTLLGKTRSSSCLGRSCPRKDAGRISGDEVWRGSWRLVSVSWACWSSSGFTSGSTWITMSSRTSSFLKSRGRSTPPPGMADWTCAQRPRRGRESPALHAGVPAGEPGVDSVARLTRSARLYSAWFLCWLQVVPPTSLRLGEFSIWGMFFAHMPGLSAVRDPKRLIYIYELTVVLLAGLLLLESPERFPGSIARIFLSSFCWSPVGTHTSSPLTGRTACIASGSRRRLTSIPRAGVSRVRPRPTRHARITCGRSMGWMRRSSRSDMDSHAERLQRLDAQPPGFDESAGTRGPSRVRRWIEGNALTGVCALDIEERTMTPFEWTAFPLLQVPARDPAVVAQLERGHALGAGGARIGQRVRNAQPLRLVERRWQVRLEVARRAASGRSGSGRGTADSSIRRVGVQRPVVDESEGPASTMFPRYITKMRLEM